MLLSMQSLRGRNFELSADAVAEARALARGEKRGWSSVFGCGLVGLRAKCSTENTTADSSFADASPKADSQLDREDSAGLTRGVSAMLSSSSRTTGTHGAVLFTEAPLDDESKAASGQLTERARDSSASGARARGVTTGPVHSTGVSGRMVGVAGEAALWRRWWCILDWNSVASDDAGHAAHGREARERWAIVGAG